MKRFEEFYPKARARIWPLLSYMCHNLALTVLHLAWTVLYLDMTVLYVFSNAVPEEGAAEDEGHGDAEPHDQEREERSEGHGPGRFLLARKEWIYRMKNKIKVKSV